MPPPFGQLRVTAAHILEVALRVNRVGEGGDHVGNDKPPFVVVDGAADLLVLKKRDAGFRIGGRFVHGVLMTSQARG